MGNRQGAYLKILPSTFTQHRDSRHVFPRLLEANENSANDTRSGLGGGVRDASASSKCAIDGTGVTELTQGRTPVASDSLEGIVLESNHVGNRHCALFEDSATTFTQHRHSRHVFPRLLAKLIRSLLTALPVDLVMG